jgi:imidazolonepropionase-like amidohydrolase
MLKGLSEEYGMRFSVFLAVFAVHGMAQESGRLSLYFLQLPVGQETYELQNGVLHASFEYTERNSKVPLTATLRVKPDLTPLEFEIHGKSYRPFSVDAHFVAEGNSVPERFFTVDGYAPFSVQMMMLRYWNTHGRPARLAQFPADRPDADISIEVAGEDTIEAGGKKVKLTRYSIRNVVWGRESVWMDGDGGIAAATTHAAGMPIEAIRPEFAAALPQLIRVAIADRMKEGEKLKREMPTLASGTFAIEGATLIDGTGRAPVADSVVLVRDGRIVSAGPRADVKLPTGVRKVDAKGETLLPGLWEMHAHYMQVEWGPTYLAAGVTTARDLGNEFEFITTVRDKVASGAVLGPRLVLAGLVDGSGPATFGVNWADTPEQGRAMVAKYHAAGFQQMKIYDYIKPDVLRAIAGEAHKQGMSVTGHVPRGMTAMQGVEAGMDQINHLGSVFQAMRTEGAGKAIQFFREHNTVVDPTMAWNELLGRPKNFEISSFEPGFAKAPYALTNLIGTAGTAPAAVEQSARFHEQLDAILALHKGGVTLVAGTDKAIPGHSLHRELELYVEAGLTPMEVIQLATLGAARVMRMDGDTGSVEAGKRADLILVNGDPLRDFTTLRQVTRVVANGRMYDTAGLWKSVDFRP